MPGAYVLWFGMAWDVYSNIMDFGVFKPYKMIKLFLTEVHSDPFICTAETAV